MIADRRQKEDERRHRNAQRKKGRRQREAQAIPFEIDQQADENQRDQHRTDACAEAWGGEESRKAAAEKDDPVRKILQHALSPSFRFPLRSIVPFSTSRGKPAAGRRSQAPPYRFAAWKWKSVPSAKSECLFSRSRSRDHRRRERHFNARGKVLKAALGPTASAGDVFRRPGKDRLQVSLGHSGVFIPQEYLNGTVLRIASFTPAYWCITADNRIAELTDFGFPSLSPSLSCMLVELGFAAAFLPLGLLAGKKKRAAE